METDFLPSENNVFLVRAIMLLVENIIGIRNKQFSKREFILASGQLIFWLVETNFSHFSETPARDNPWKPFSFVQRKHQ